MAVWKICALLAHICWYWDFSTSSFTLKLNSALQWSHLINLSCRMALFSKMRLSIQAVYYPDISKWRGFAAIFPLIFFSLVILCISIYFLGNLAMRCLSVYWKCEGFWDLWNKVFVHFSLWEESSSSPEFTEFYQPQHSGKGDLKSRAYERETHTKLFLCKSWKESWNRKSESISKWDFDGK